MVCFGEKIWIKLKEVVYEKRGAFKKRCSKRGKKVIGVSKPAEGDQGNGSYGKCFRLNGSGIRIDPWGEKIKWAMVIDPENPLGDLTREEEIRITELEKGIGNTSGVIRKWHQR
ncbi:MAG: hypothetical protein V3S49_01040 [Thermodesulfobacteriota bacterium]